MKIITIILLVSLCSCATPQADYCDPSKPGLFLGLRCINGGYDNYIKKAEGHLEDEKTRQRELQSRQQYLEKKKEEKLKEFYQLKVQLETIEKEIENINNDIDRLKGSQWRREQLSEKLKKLSNNLKQLANTYETLSSQIIESHSYDSSGSQIREVQLAKVQKDVRQLKKAATEARTLADRIWDFALELIIPEICDLLPLTKTMKHVLHAVKIGWAFYNNFIRA